MSTDGTYREPLQQGDEFLQYRIGSLLGRGGHAFVYAAQHRYMERPVAIKIIAAPGSTNTEIHKRAQLEAQILSQLEHPNVVKIYDAGVTGAGVIYIVMEMLEGWTLRSALKSLHVLTPHETLHVGLQIAAAVQMAHAQHAIHRDLKPENAFVLPGNLIKVLDFGITKLLGTSVSMTTQPNLIRGTPQYMSPEHMQGHAVTVRSDIYALGSVLYELLGGTAPALIGLQELSSYAIGYSQIHRMPPRLDELRPDIPTHLASSIQRMLAKDPEDRPASMREVADELRALQARLAVESPTLAGTLRELWHAPLLAPHDPVVEQRSRSVTGASSATVLLVPSKTPSSGPEHKAIAMRGRGVRTPDAMALRLTDRRSSSAPVPVTLQRARTRTPSHTASFVIVAVVSGSILGYGALMRFRGGQWVNQPPRPSASQQVAASTAVHADERVPSSTAATASTTATSSASVTRSSSAGVGSTLAEGRSKSMGSTASTQNTIRPHAPALVESPAAESDSGTALVAKDASRKRANAKPAASTAYPALSSSNKDQLIFGAEDLAW